MFNIWYYIKLTRPLNLLIILFTLYMVRFGFVYPVFRLWGIHLQVNEFVFAAFSLAFVLMAAGGYVINDFYDIKIDAVNKPEKVIIGRQIKQSGALAFYWVVSISGLISGCWAAYKMELPWAGSLFIIYFFGLWFYSYSLKRILLAGNVIIALFVALVPLASGSVELARFINSSASIDFEAVHESFLWICGISFFAFMLTLVREITKDLEDAEGDSADGCRTLPVVLGQKRAKRVVQLLFLLIIILFVLLDYDGFRNYDMTFTFAIIYYACFIQIPLIFLFFKINKSQTAADFHKISFWLKAIMVSGMCYLFVFAVQIMSIVDLFKEIIPRK